MDGVLIAFCAFVAGYYLGKDKADYGRQLANKLSAKSSEIYHKLVADEKLKVFHTKQPKSPEQENLEQVEKELNK